MHVYWHQMFFFFYDDHFNNFEKVNLYISEISHWKKKGEKERKQENNF